MLAPMDSGSLLTCAGVTFMSSVFLIKLWSETGPVLPSIAIGVLACYVLQILKRNGRSRRERLAARAAQENEGVYPEDWA